MFVDISLFLQNVYAALVNQQYRHAQFLLECVIKLAEGQAGFSSPPPFDVGVGLHRGRVREDNEDCVLALNGVLADTRHFGLYVVCDGMGGHVHGQDAAHLAIQTILEHVFPLITRETVPSGEHLLAKSVQQANRAIYLQNKSMEQPSVASGVPVNTSKIHRMGTTVTAVLVLDETAYVANVGDSRTYIYNQSLSRITRDHSLVAQLLADGILQEEEEIYTHPHRNRITRALGAEPSVQVDTFVVPLRGNEILLLCSDGLWEMTRDRKIEEVLSSSWATASSMTNQLVKIANEGGGADNIGCIVIQLQKRTDISAMETAILDPVGALTRLVTSS